jgi:hypothetical protein
MTDISFEYYSRFNKVINQYLVFLVHIQQSEKIAIKDKIPIFDSAKANAHEISSLTQKYFSNLNDYNALEKEQELKKGFDKIVKNINQDLKTTEIIIDETKLFLFDDIIEKLTAKNKDVYLSSTDIKNILFYKELDTTRRQDKKELAELTEKQQKELEEIKFKAFESLINSKNEENNNPELFYRITRKILAEYNKTDIQYSEEELNEVTLNRGLYFVKIQKELKIVEKREGLLTRYSIRILDMNYDFTIYIQGSIRIDEQEQSFKIYERYENGKFDQVINSYKLKPIIELFNEFFIEKYRSENEPTKNDKIEDYLSGKIQR